MTSETTGQGVLHDDFDLLLNDVLRTAANPEMPERLRIDVQTRVWVRSVAAPPTATRPPVVFAPADFQARMRPQRDARSTGLALLLHAAAIALIVWGVAAHVPFSAPVRLRQLTELTPPPIAPTKSQDMGGGGGQRSPAPVSKGRLPKFTDQQITPPAAPPLSEPRIRMPDASIEVQKDLRMANNQMPNLGMPNSPLAGSSLGNGSGTGIGSGNGSGLGAGTGGNYGGGLRTIGGGVSAPVILFQVEPEFSEEARKAKTSGNVVVNLIVDAEGRPQRIRVLRGVGMGLDQKAIAAVQQYRFKPAMEAGRPVPVELNIEVNFQIF